MKLVAFDGRMIRVARSDGGYRAVVSIAGRPAYLRRIYVQTRETGTLPKVVYVELRGSDAATKTPVLERIASR